MNRQPINDGTARWFDLEAATRFEEDSYHDGQNRISRATGSQWNHEELFHTATGAWILHYWSQYQGRGESWKVLDDDDAHAWLVRNGHEAAVPAEFLAAQEV